MSDKIMFEFHYRDIDKEGQPTKESIESRGYKQAVKIFQGKYPKLKTVYVTWDKDGVELSKEQRLPMGRFKKVGK